MSSKKQHDQVHLKVQVWIWARLQGRIYVLILKTRPDRGGFWQPVTGSVEKGEALGHAALREAQEETSLSFKGRVARLGDSFRFQSRWGGKSEEQGYSLEAKISQTGVLPQVTLDPHEHTDYEWISPSDALKKIEFLSNRRLLRVLLKQLRQIQRSEPGATQKIVKKKIAKKTRQKTHR